jgi:hypothetical protein
MKIIKIHLSHLNNEGHYQFLRQVHVLLDRYPGVKSRVIVLYDKQVVLLVLEGRLVDAMRGSEYSGELSGADKRVDRCIVGINKLVGAGMHHFDAGVASAAKRIYERLKVFGNIESKSYEEETVAIHILLADLRGPYAAKAELIGLMPWIEELEAAIEAFDALFMLRNEELANRPTEKLTDVRRENDGIYAQITDRVDAAALLEESHDVFDAFIGELNTLISYFNDHDHHQAKKEIVHALVEAIPTQAWTDEPVIVIPVVFFNEDGKPARKLVFSVDFTVTYKDNVNVGAATLIIHGKGAFKGTKSVPFNIAAQIKN